MLELGILKTYDSETHKAGVQLAGSLTTYLDDIPVATNIAAEAMIIGNYVLVAIPGGNPRDACVVASWPQGSSGGGGGGSKIQDADGDTYLWVEKTADEDKIHGAVNGVEAFLLDNNGIRDLPQQSAASAYLNVNTNIPSQTLTKINLNAKSYDIQNEFDVTTNHRYIASTAGRYLVVGKIRYYDNQDGIRYMSYIYKNGTYVSTTGLVPGGAGSCYLQNIAIISLAVNDYLELWTWQGEAGVSPIRGLAGHTELAVYKLG